MGHFSLPDVALLSDPQNIEYMSVTWVSNHNTVWTQIIFAVAVVALFAALESMWANVKKWACILRGCILGLYLKSLVPRVMTSLLLYYMYINDFFVVFSGQTSFLSSIVAPCNLESNFGSTQADLTQRHCGATSCHRGRIILVLHEEHWCQTDSIVKYTRETTLAADFHERLWAGRPSFCVTRLTHV